MKRQTCFRLSAEDIELLDLIKERVGIESRTSVVRYTLRWFKRTELEKGPKVHFTTQPRIKSGRVFCGNQRTFITKVTTDPIVVTCQRCKQQLKKDGVT